jgi:two-component system sensor histidine kinase KdpD
VERQRNDMQKLYELSRRTLSLDLHLAPGAKLVQLIVEIFAVEAVAIFDADLDASDIWGYWRTDVKELARNTCHFETNQDDAKQRISRRVLRLGAVPIGAVVLRGELNPLTIDAIASLVSVTFDRYRSFANEARAEAAHQSEQMRTTVLDELAHAFKTPLTAIRTASVGLLEIGAASPVQADLATLIEEQSVLLNDLATRLLQTAHLDAEAITIAKETVPIVRVIEEVIAEQAGQLGDHAIEVSIRDRSLAVRGDREFLAIIVRQFVDNAVKYSYPRSKIGITAEASASEILIAVHNEGDPIRLEDRERIFERFYRCPETKDRVQGTGIGLSIAKRAAEAHNGHVWVISGKEEGTTFFLSIEGLRGGIDEHA